MSQERRQKLEPKMFYQTYAACKEAEITPPSLATEWCHLPLHNVICSECIPFCHCWGWWEWTAHFLSRVTSTFDLDIQTRPSEGPNTSSLWMWRISVQPFPKYLSDKQKKSLVMKHKIKETELTWNWSKWTMQLAIKMGFNDKISNSMIVNAFKELCNRRDHEIFSTNVPQDSQVGGPPDNRYEWPTQSQLISIESWSGHIFVCAMMPTVERMECNSTIYPTICPNRTLRREE